MEYKRKRKWNKQDLKKAVKESFSFRSVIKKIGLIPAGGNYKQIKKYIQEENLDISHFTGKGWSKGKTGIGKPRILTKDILKKNTSFQSYKLKNRLFTEGYKKPECEICFWKKKRFDGKIPVELDHINGDNKDNRIQNLRILCPNCHSLQKTHRGLNRKNNV